MSQHETLDKPSLASDYGKCLLHAITSLTAEVSQASSRDEVLGLVAAWLPNIVPADRAAIAFPADADHLAVHALEGNTAIEKGRPVPIAGTPTGTAFSSKQVIRVDDTSKRSDPACRALSSQGLMSCLCAPLINQGQALGTLNAAHWKRGVYSSEHEALLRMSPA